jgi:hypothetical protein
MTDRNALLLTGNILPFLNFGFGNIMSKVNGGILDLSFDGDERITKTYDVTIYTTLASGTSITTNRQIFFTNSGDGAKVSFDSGSLSGQEYDASTLGNALNAKTSKLGDMLGGLAGNYMASGMKAGVIGTIVGTIVDVATGEELSAQARVSQFATNVAIDKFSSALTSTIAQTLNLSPISAMVLNLGVVGVVTESLEYATGLDSVFGLGGEIVGSLQSINGKISGVYEQSLSVNQAISNSFGSLGIAIGISGSYTNLSYERKTFENGTYSDGTYAGGLDRGYDSELGSWRTDRFGDGSFNFSSDSFSVNYSDKTRTSTFSNDFGSSLTDVDTGTVAKFEKNYAGEDVMSMTQYSGGGDSDGNGVSSAEKSRQDSYGGGSGSFGGDFGV